MHLRIPFACLCLLGCAARPAAECPCEPTPASSPAASTAPSTPSTAAAPPAETAASGLQPSDPGELRPEPADSPQQEPPWASHLSSNCQAKLAFAEEVTRLLVKAAAHATSSGACVDASGERVVVDQILVCPGRSSEDSAVFHTRYRVTRTGEGDTRMCSREPGGCSWTKPVSTQHFAELRFTGRGGTYRIEIPPKVPGMEDATPLGQVHEGGCYGKSPAFVPQAVKKN